MISEGHTGWEKHDTMTCDHRDPCKELRYPGPAGPLLDYMKHRRVFKAKKSNEYDLCCFYRVELSGDLPTFPSLCKPATHEMLEDFLLKARALGHPNLVVAFVQDSAMAVCLLQELHRKDSLRCLPMRPKPDAGGKAIKELSFCLLCLYNGSNDLSYMNHILCRHYNANYGCRQCLKEVFIMGQQLENHLKICTGFPKAGTPSSSEKEPMRKVPRRAPKQACTIASVQRRRSQTLPRSPVGKVPTPRCTRSPHTTRRRHHKRKSVTGGTRQTRASPTNPARIKLHGWPASDVHPLAAMHTKGSTSIFPVLFQL